MDKTIIAEMPLTSPPEVIRNQTNGIYPRRNPVRMMSEYERRLLGPSIDELRKEDALRLRGAFVLRHKGKALRRHPLKPVRLTHRMEQQLAYEGLMAAGDYVMNLRSGLGKVASILKNKPLNPFPAEGAASRGLMLANNMLKVVGVQLKVAGE